MKIGLISPKRGQLIRNEELADFFGSSTELKTRTNIIYRWPELGLLTLAGLIPKDKDIRYIDEEIEPINFDEHFDLVAITALTPKASRAYEVADEFRKRGVYVVMGGPHASVMPEEASAHVDSVFVGEAQILWDKFMSDFKGGSTQKIYSSKGRLTDMHTVKTPRYDLLDANQYKIIPIETTRGCPHDCEFCSSTRLWGKTYRKKTIEQVMAEIDTIQQTTPGKYLFFVDDNMFVNRNYSYRLLECLKQKGKLRWFTQTDISIADDEKLLKDMFKAGCREVLIGFETLAKKNMKDVDSKQWKLKRLAKYPEAIEIIQSKGISIYGSFILGLDHDTEEVFENVRDFIFETKLIGFQILILTPIPGTRVRERLIKEDRITNINDWSRYSTYQLNHRLNHMSKQTFEKGMVRLFKEVYSDESFHRRKKHYKNLLKQL